MRRALLLLSLLVVAACGGEPSESEKDAAIAAARQAYAEAIEQGVDMRNGPCLGVIMDNWVADVSHDPRADVDEDPGNQCEAYREGEADHFVELDPDGNVIRAE